MAILDCDFNIYFGQTLAPDSSLSSTLATELCALTESSIVVESMVKFIWQHYQWGFIALLKCPLQDWIFGAQRANFETSPETPKPKVRELSQSGF